MRILCGECAEPYALRGAIRDEEDEVLLEEGTELKRAAGCARCHHTGYRGRVGIFELLEIDDDIRDLVKARAGKRAYKEVLRWSTFSALRRAGLERAREGVTSLEEVLRVT